MLKLNQKIQRSPLSLETGQRRLLKHNVQGACVPHPKRQCPARESKCIKCSKVGHWAKALKSLSDKRVNEVNFSDTQDEAFFLSELTEVAFVQGHAQRSWKAKVVVNHQNLKKTLVKMSQWFR